MINVYINGWKYPESGNGSSSSAYKTSSDQMLKGMCVNKKKNLHPFVASNCASCVHYVKPDNARKYTDTGQGICFEGGFSEIGDPFVERSKEDCNAFELNRSIFLASRRITSSRRI
jgi:hypothetical protein